MSDTFTDSNTASNVTRFKVPALKPRWWMCYGCGHYWNAQHPFRDSDGRPPVPHEDLVNPSLECSGPIVGLIELPETRYGGEARDGR